MQSWVQSPLLKKNVNRTWDTFNWTSRCIAGFSGEEKMGQRIYLKK
jgi:hypothetical protein